MCDDKSVNKPKVEVRESSQWAKCGVVFRGETFVYFRILDWARQLGIFVGGGISGIFVQYC